EARAAALLADARAEAALSEDAPREAFRRFAARLHGEGLEGLLDRLALRRADFRRFAARHQGELFAVQALRHRHGAAQSAEEFAAVFFASVDWKRLREAAAVSAAPSANGQKADARLIAIFACMDSSETPLKAIRSC